MNEQIETVDDGTTQPGSGEIPPEMLITESQRKHALVQHKRFQAKDDPRTAIFRKADQRHEAEVEQFCEANAEARAQQEQVAVQAAAGHKPQHTIVVYGKEVDPAEATQVVENADQELALREAQLDEYARTLQRQTAALQQAQQRPAAPVVDKAKIKEAHEALLRGDDIESAELMAAALAGVTAQAAPQPAHDPIAHVSREARARINAAFNQNFGHIDDDTFAMAQGMMRARLTDPRNFGRPPEDLVREVGSLVTRLHGQSPPATPQPEPRRTLKASFPLTVPPHMSLPAPPPPPAPTLANNRSYVESLRTRSGSNSTQQLRRRD